jgi:hypothetical protein
MHMQARTHSVHSALSVHNSIHFLYIFCPSFIVLLPCVRHACVRCVRVDARVDAHVPPVPWWRPRAARPRASRSFLRSRSFSGRTARGWARTSCCRSAPTPTTSVSSCAKWAATSSATETRPSSRSCSTCPARSRPSPSRHSNAVRHFACLSRSLSSLLACFPAYVRLSLSSVCPSGRPSVGRSVGRSVCLSFCLACYLLGVFALTLFVRARPSLRLALALVLIGLAVVVVGFPATPLLLSRARFCVSAAHTRADLDYALEKIAEISQLIGIRYNSASC